MNIIHSLIRLNLQSFMFGWGYFQLLFLCIMSLALNIKYHKTKNHKILTNSTFFHKLILPLPSRGHPISPSTYKFYDALKTKLCIFILRIQSFYIWVVF
ncbi:hypothetical protein CN290_27540 [Bacillus cereus]|uniref:Uncharacterized protein n=1 Tax=Bacillus cereus TaxID=1396 RepID=A0A2C1YAJ8_BACCE|nr:hypothetical protein CN290_27540 [Bacillus cereus]PFV10491.1 hypothetical protein COL10_15655 [Bacillus cereus]PGV42140.1 hypothetical protein COD74_20800 [Bacillus cereus]